MPSSKTAARRQQARRRGLLHSKHRRSAIYSSRSLHSVALCVFNKTHVDHLVASYGRRHVIPLGVSRHRRPSKKSNCDECGASKSTRCSVNSRLLPFALSINGGQKSC